MIYTKKQAELMLMDRNYINSGVYSLEVSDKEFINHQFPTPDETFAKDELNEKIKELTDFAKSIGCDVTTIKSVIDTTINIVL